MRAHPFLVSTLSQVILPQFLFLFHIFYLFFICMHFYNYLTVRSFFYILLQYVCAPTIFTLFLCLPHLFLLSSKCNNFSGSTPDGRPGVVSLFFFNQKLKAGLLNKILTWSDASKLLHLYTIKAKTF